MWNTKTIRRTCLTMAVMASGWPAIGQEQPPAPAPQDAAVAAPTAPAKVSAEEIDSLVAPIALYPDSLLSQVLMAATYPLEVVQAHRFVTTNPSLTGDAMADALAQQHWDPSVKSLTNFPSVLQMMDDKLDWTVSLGNAFLAQQPDVMDSVQRLRAQAQAAGNLQSSEQQRVTYMPADVVVGSPAPQTQYIVIDNPNPQFIYVPVYDPLVVFGAWRYADHRPYFWHPREYVPTGGIWYGPRCDEGPSWGYAWGRPDWQRRDIDIDIHRHENINIKVDREEIIRSEHVTETRPGRSEWQHDPAHRGGIVYSDTHTAQRYGARTPEADVRAREQYRGRVGTPQAHDAPKPDNHSEDRSDARPNDRENSDSVNRNNARDAQNDHDTDVNRNNVRSNGDKSVKHATEQRDTEQSKPDQPKADQHQADAPHEPAPRPEPERKSAPAPEHKAPAAPAEQPRTAPPQHAEPDRPANNPRATPAEGSGTRGAGDDARADSERGRSSRGSEGSPAVPARSSDGGGNGASGGGGAARH